MLDSPRFVIIYCYSYLVVVLGNAPRSSTYLVERCINPLAFFKLHNHNLAESPSIRTKINGVGARRGTITLATYNLEGEDRIELSLAESNSAVLPLHYSPIK